MTNLEARAHELASRPNRCLLVQCIPWTDLMGLVTLFNPPPKNTGRPRIGHPNPALAACPPKLQLEESGFGQRDTMDCCIVEGRWANGHPPSPTRPHSVLLSKFGLFCAHTERYHTATQSRRLRHVLRWKNFLVQCLIKYRHYWPRKRGHPVGFTLWSSSPCG